MGLGLDFINSQTNKDVKGKMANNGFDVVKTMLCNQEGFVSRGLLKALKYALDLQERKIPKSSEN
jgi:hypothetical protein